MNQSEYEPQENSYVSEIETRIKKSKYPVLRPFASQHTVWLDKKKHFVQSKVDKKSRKLVLTMDSPQEKWQGTRKLSFLKELSFVILHRFLSVLPDWFSKSCK